MGTWGPAAFDNDTALDFVVVVEEKGFKAVGKRLTAFDHLDGDDCAEAIAAAAIVAATRGHLVDDFPIEITGRLATYRKRATEDDFVNARQALEQIEKDSEWKDLWRETGDTRQLTKVLHDLLKKLAADPVDLPPKPPRPKVPKHAEGDIFVTYLGFEYWCAVKILFVPKVRDKGVVQVGVYDLVLKEPVVPDELPDGFLLTRTLFKDELADAEERWTKVGHIPVTDDEWQLTLALHPIGDRDEVWLGDEMIRYATKKDVEELGLPTISSFHGDFAEQKKLSRQIGAYRDSAIWYLDRLAAVEDWKLVILVATNIVEGRFGEDYPDEFVADAYEYRAKAYKAIKRHMKAEQDLMMAAKLKTKRKS
jgi:hypothetical protein